MMLNSNISINQPIFPFPNLAFGLRANAFNPLSLNLISFPTYLLLLYLFKLFWLFNLTQMYSSNSTIVQLEDLQPALLMPVQTFL